MKILKDTLQKDNQGEKNMKLFISYSHKDEEYVKEFIKHLIPLKDNGLIEEWYDRKVLPGDEYQDKIDNNLEDSDIICLFISSDFLSSDSCKKEKKKALELRRTKNVTVIPIIIRKCGWLDDKEISNLLALPTDGKPITNFINKDEAYHDIYNGLKRILEQEKTIRNLKLKDNFYKFLEDTEMLSKSHSRKQRVLLNDIFIYPEIIKYDELKDLEETISSEKLIDEILKYNKIVVTGERLSGKTTICKKIFIELLNMGFFPVYVSDRRNSYKGIIDNIIWKAFEDQYNVSTNEIEIIKANIGSRLIPIIDDFYIAKNKEKHIKDLNKYNYCILIVDDIFCLNIKDEQLLKDYIFYKIKELKPSLRYELIIKWASLFDKDTPDYKEIDKYVELINSTLGKTIKKGIIPAYPFFILSVLVAYEIYNIPLNQEITSQGHCYQSLIYFNLTSKKVKKDEIDIYLNFLTELSYYFFKEKKQQLSFHEFENFIKNYKEIFTLPIAPEILLRNLSDLVSIDSFKNFSFRYQYIYYFFVAKYLVENISKNENVVKEIDIIINNLHVDENAYITIFMIHHSKDINILNKIEASASSFFCDYQAATLNKDELKFFDERADTIINAVLPPNTTTPEKERAERLSIEDQIEEHIEDKDIKEDDSLAIELRRAIRTAEVIGCIIKNRIGSLEKMKLKDLFKEGMNIHLRILSSFFEIIKSENEQKHIVDFISARLEKVTEAEKDKLSREKIIDISRQIFWNLNFFVVFGIINKIIHSLGSDKLIEIINSIYHEIKDSSVYIIKSGILMCYNKTMDVDEIASKISEREFSEIARRIMKFMIVNHCSLHQINYKDKQKIESKLGIPAKKLLIDKI